MLVEEQRNEARATLLGQQGRHSETVRKVREQNQQEIDKIKRNYRNELVKEGAKGEVRLNNVHLTNDERVAFEKNLGQEKQEKIKSEYDSEIQHTSELGERRIGEEKRNSKVILSAKKLTSMPKLITKGNNLNRCKRIKAKPMQPPSEKIKISRAAIWPGSASNSKQTFRT